MVKTAHSPVAFSRLCSTLSSRCISCCVDCILLFTLVDLRATCRPRTCITLSRHTHLPFSVIFIACLDIDKSQYAPVIPVVIAHVTSGTQHMWASQWSVRQSMRCRSMLRVLFNCVDVRSLPWTRVSSLINSHNRPFRSSLVMAIHSLACQSRTIVYWARFVHGGLKGTTANASDYNHWSTNTSSMIQDILSTTAAT